MLDPKHIRPDVMIELRDEETKSWLPLTIVSVTHPNVECRMLTGEPIFATVSLIMKITMHRPACASA